MKTTRVALILGLLALGGIVRGAGTSSAPTTDPAASIYTNDDLHVKFAYPASLIKIEAPDPSAVVLFKHPQNPVGEIHLQFNAKGKDLPDSALNQVADGMVNMIKAQHGEIVSRSDAMLGQAPAVKIVFTLRSGSKTVKMSGVNAVHDGKIYNLSAAAPADQFDSFMEIVQPMYDSFAFTDWPVKK